MKEDKQKKPVYEAPKVLKLDETESAYGACESGTWPYADSCGPGGDATGCANPGSSATTSCANEGSAASGNCSANGSAASACQNGTGNG